MKVGDILARYQVSRDETTDNTETLTTSPDSENNGEQYSPLQKVVYELLNHALPLPVRSVARKLFPDMNTFLDMLDNPVVLHESISKAVAMLTIVLEKDHEHITITTCTCAETSTGREETPVVESIPSGDD